MAWTNDTIDSSGDVGIHCSIAVDSNNYPHIAYLYHVSPSVADLRYIYWTGSAWSTFEVISSSTAVDRVSLQIDGSNKAHVSYKKGTGIWYSTNATGSWVESEVAPLLTWNTLYSGSLALDDNDLPHITYLAQNAFFNTALFYLEISDPPSLANLDFNYSAIFPTLKIKSNGNPCVGYANTNNEIKYVEYNGASWDSPQIISGGSNVNAASMDLDGNDYPNVIYESNNRIFYLNWTGVAWTTPVQASHPTWSVTGQTELRVDSNDLPKFVYYGDNHLRYSYFDGVIWVHESPDSDLRSGSYNSLVLDTLDVPHIAQYIQDIYDDLRYTAPVPVLAWLPTYPQTQTPTMGSPATFIEVKTGTNLDSDAYLMVLADGATPPTSQQVKDGTDPDTLLPIVSTSHDSVSLTASVVNADGTFYASALTANTPYDVWIVAEDGLGLMSTPTKLDYTTAPDPQVYFVNANGSDTAPYDTAVKGSTSISDLILAIGGLQFGDTVEVVDDGEIIELATISPSADNVVIRSFGTDGSDRQLRKPTIKTSAPVLFDSKTGGYENFIVRDLRIIPQPGCVRAIEALSGEFLGNIIEGALATGGSSMIYGEYAFKATNNLLNNIPASAVIINDVGDEGTESSSLSNTIYGFNGAAIRVETGVAYAYNNNITGNGIAGTIALSKSALITATLVQDYNLIHDVETEYENTITQPHNIDSVNDPGNTDPRFSDPGVDFTLQETSPAIGAAAEPVVYPDIPTDDIVGYPRSSDIGSYEFVPEDVDGPILPEPSPPIIEEPCEEPVIPAPRFWDFLTTFWDFLKSEDRIIFENYWSALKLTTDSIVEKASRFFEAIAPERARTCVFDDFYDVQIGPLYSRPLNLDPTVKEPNNTIRPIGLKLIEPEYNGETPIYRDEIQLAKADYDKIRGVGLNTYVVINPKREEIETKYFQVFNLLSSEEPTDKFTYAEIDDSLNVGGPSDTIGRIAIQGIQSGIEQFKVHVLASASATSVTWDTDSLFINVNDTTGDIAEVFAALPGTGTPWADLINKSGYGQTEMPIFAGVIPFDSGAEEIDDLPNFIYEEASNGRYTPPNGMAWKWYENYPQSGDIAGEAGKGEWVPAPAKFNYLLKVDGDLFYLKNESFTLHLTTGRSYGIHDYILDVPNMQSFISYENPPEFKKFRDFAFDNHIVEFAENILENGDYENGDYLYVKKAERIEDYLFDLYGTVVNVPSWLNYNYDKYSAKASISGLMRSLQNSSNREEYERALNIYYGLPIAPQESEVIGLYESYGYEVLEKNGDLIALDLPPGEDLSDFVQVGTRLFLEQKLDVKVAIINNRSSGTITLEDASDVEIGDRIYPKLRNKFYIKRIIAEDYGSPGDPAFIEIYSPEGEGAIQHLIDVVVATSDEVQYPEIVVYGTENLDNNYNGIYHITAALKLSLTVVRLTIYRAPVNTDPLYNDYIGVTTPIDASKNIKAGFVHIPWPTHKFLYLLMDGAHYFKAYLDAPIDTIYDEGDKLEKYQVVARNVSALTNDMFPDWNQFDKFVKFNGIDIDSRTLELTKAIPGAKFGEYFPSRFQTLI